MKTFVAVLVLGFLGVCSAASAAETVVESEVQKPRWRYFDGGFLLQSAMPGNFSNIAGDAPENGVGWGYGFTFGVKPMPELTIQAILDGVFHGANVQKTPVNEYATNVAAGLNAKFYPLASRGIRAYALVGFAYTKHLVHESFGSIFGDLDKAVGVAYSGWRYSVGAGYEFPLSEVITLYGEVDLSHVRLTKRVFRDFPSRDLAEPATRWAPAVRVGLSASF